MPTIFVKGKQVPVSDDFFNLPPEEQEATVRRIAEQIAFDAITGPLRPGQPSTNTSAKADRELSVGEYAEDAAKSLGVGVAKGGIGLAGTGGDIREGIAGASGWLAEKLGVSPQSSKRFADVVRDGIAANPALPMHGPTSDEITDLVRRATTPAPTLTQLVTGESPQSFIDRIPRSTTGEILQTFGEHVPAALAGPGGVIRKTALAVVPTALNETAGRVARATGNEEYEHWARLGGDLLGGGVVFTDDLMHLAKPRGAALDAERPVSTELVPMVVKVKPNTIIGDAEAASSLDDIGATAGGKRTTAGRDMGTTPTPIGASGESDRKMDFGSPPGGSLGNDGSAGTPHVTSAKLPRQHFLAEGLEKKRHNYPSTLTNIDDIGTSMDDMPMKSRNKQPKVPLHGLPTTSQRPFAADYPKTPAHDETGKLMVDVDGDPIIARYVAGRNSLDGNDQGFDAKIFREIARMLTNVEVVPRRYLGDSLGAMIPGSGPRDVKAIRLAKELPKRHMDFVLAHELGHLLHLKAGLPPIIDPVMRAELQRNYSRLRTGLENPEKLTLPRDVHRSYDDPVKSDQELVAYGYYSALADPNYAKKLLPVSYATLRKWIKSNPETAKILINNSVAAATVATALAAAGERDEAKAGASPPRTLQGGLPGIPGVPPSTANSIAVAAEAKRVGAYGSTEHTRAPSRRGHYPRAPKSEKFKDLAQALVNLKARQEFQRYGGPR